MARLELKGGPRDGDVVNCCLESVCECTTWGHGYSGRNMIQDGYVEFRIYRREGQYLVPDHIEKVTMIAKGFCPKCNRAMPDETVNCKNCGAEMDPLGWSEP